MSVSIAAKPQGEAAPRTGTAISTHDLVKRFGKRTAVDNLTVSIPHGSVYGFLGLNGAGKSTAIRILMGLLTPNSGSASVLGLDSRRDSVAIKRRVGYVPDLPTFYEWMTIEQLCAFAAHYHKTGWDNARANHLLKVFDLDAAQVLRGLSKGQRAKVSLTLALAFNPDVLVLDEPTGGLDPIARRQFIEGVLAEFMEGERTILISSHLINEISGLVDRVGILHEGKLIRDERVDSLLSTLKQVRLYFDTDAPGVKLPGQRHLARSGREAVITVDGFQEEAVRAAASSYSPKQIEVRNLTLEEAFVALVGSPTEPERS